MLDLDVQAVLSFYALKPGAVRQIEPLANAGGWSGSRLWRVRDVDGRVLCLRRWPKEHPTTVGLRLIHAVLKLVSSELPIVALPLCTRSCSTVVEAAGHRWELTHWLAGNADFHEHPTRPRLRAAMQTLALFHLLAARYELRRGLAPAILDRQPRLQVLQHRELRHRALGHIERGLAAPLGNAIDGRAARLMELAQKAIGARNWRAEFGATPELWLQPVIRDIYHDHVLFTGDEVTGLLDFGAMRIDTPLTDIARLVGSLVGDDRQARQFAFNAYSELRSLNDSDRGLIDLLDASGLVLGGINWLIWLYVERRDMGPVEPIVRRLDEILARLESRAVGHTMASA